MTGRLAMPIVVAIGVGCCGRSPPAVAPAPASAPRSPNHATLTEYLAEEATFSRIDTGPTGTPALRANRVEQRVEHVSAQACTLAIHLYTVATDLDVGTVRDDRRVRWVVPLRSIDHEHVVVRPTESPIPERARSWTVALYPAEPRARIFGHTVHFMRTMMPPDEPTSESPRSESLLSAFALIVPTEEAARRIADALAAAFPERERW